MSRLAVLSIVLMLAAGQSSAVLCRIACHPGDSPTPACEHHDAMVPTRLAGADACAETTAGMAAVVREEVRGGAASSEMAPAPVPAFSIPLSSAARPGGALTVRHRLQGQPLPTVLRI